MFGSCPAAKRAMYLHVFRSCVQICVLGSGPGLLDAPYPSRRPLATLFGETYARSRSMSRHEAQQHSAATNTNKVQQHSIPKQNGNKRLISVRADAPAITQRSVRASACIWGSITVSPTKEPPQWMVDRAAAQPTTRRSFERVTPKGGGKQQGPA